MPDGAGVAEGVGEAEDLGVSVGLEVGELVGSCATVELGSGLLTGKKVLLGNGETAAG